MASVEIDFDVYKSLTALRATEETTFNDVIRDLLGLGPKSKQAADDDQARGLELKGVFLPNGTQFRVTYKGQTHTAEIKDGAWIGGDGVRRGTPSEAACAVTQTNVNGWRFWKVKRPSDTSWRVLNSLRSDRTG